MMDTYIYRIWKALKSGYNIKKYKRGLILGEETQGSESIITASPEKQIKLPRVLRFLFLTFVWRF